MPEQATGRQARPKAADVKEMSSLDRRKQEAKEASTDADEEVHQLKDRKESHSKASVRKEGPTLVEAIGEEVLPGQQTVKKHGKVGGKPFTLVEAAKQSSRCPRRYLDSNLNPYYRRTFIVQILKFCLQEGL